MGSRIRCFWVEPIQRCELSLRRYYSGEKTSCTTSGYGYHNVSVVIGRFDHLELINQGWPEAKEYQNLVHTMDNNVITKVDPRWPTNCSCGYQFQDSDQWQCNPDQLYQRADIGEVWTLRSLPAGAMYDAHWLHGWQTNKYDDGVMLTLVTPGGTWEVDGPSWNNKVRGPGWTRTGVIPDVTAQPSILIPGKYHGWLRNGWLEEC